MGPGGSSFIHGGQSPDATPQRSAIVVAVFILFVVVVIVVCAKPVVASYADEIGSVVGRTQALVFRCLTRVVCSRIAGKSLVRIVVH
jgi:hypothetical protein